MEQINILIMIVSLAGSLAFSAFFSGTETALMAISKLRLRHLAETKPRRAMLVEQILRKPEKLIGTILLGNNLVNVAMTAIATAIAISIWGQKGIVFATAFLTIIILVFAEITPKVYSKYFNERVAFITAPVIKIIITLFNPVVQLIIFVSNRILSILGVDVSRVKRPLMTEAELMTCIKMGEDAGAITPQEKKILSRVFTLNDKSVREIMVPREKMVILDINAPLEDILRTILRTGHSRFPVKRGKDLEIIGFIHAKDLFKLNMKKRSVSIKNILRPPFFARADKKIDSQLRNFQAKKIHQAIVLDKKGKVTGLITLEDILEELVGSIEDEHDFE
jgi:putative hemolysin